MILTIQVSAAMPIGRLPLMGCEAVIQVVFS
jgi:hypothetical protein